MCKVVSTRDVGMCAEKYPYGQCLGAVFILEGKTYDQCGELEDESLITICQAYFSGDDTMCEPLTNEIALMTCRAFALKDESFCAENFCRSFLKIDSARRAGDASECKGLDEKDPNTFHNILLEVMCEAAIKGDGSLCDQYLEEFPKARCEFFYYLSLARHYEEPAFCDEIKFINWRKYCRSEMSS